MKLRRVKPGLYETPNGTEIQHRPDIDGWWYVTYPGQRAPDDVYPTLRDARDNLAHQAQAAADAEVETSPGVAEAIILHSHLRRSRRRSG